MPKGAVGYSTALFIFYEINTTIITWSHHTLYSTSVCTDIDGT